MNERALPAALNCNDHQPTLCCPVQAPTSNKRAAPPGPFPPRLALAQEGLNQRRMVPAVEAFGGEIVECCVLADRSGGLATLESPLTRRSYPLRALWQLSLPVYEPGPAT